jgi:CHASE3 domain sensor protein
MAKLLKSVKLYILFGYFTLILIASVTVWVIYNETLELYDNQIDLNPVSNKIFLANSILTDLYEAENLERSYLQTGSSKYYEDYNILIDSISSHIDILGSIESNPSQLVHTDSIQKLLTKKRENLKELNSIKNSASSEKLYERALLKITQNKDSLDRLFQVYTSLSTNKDSVVSKQKKARFFERLIDVFAPPAEQDSSLNVIHAESIIKDSINNAFNPTDSVEQIMASIIEEIHNESVIYENQLIKKEQENLENAQTITLQIRQILSQLENEEILHSLNKVSTQQEHIRQMTNIVIVLGAAALLVIIGFLILILKDITRSQHYRQTLEKEKAYSESLLKSKEQLMLSVTHDLKSPLNSITGFAHLAARENVPERQSQYLKNIEHSANYILRLIKDLLDFARLETGKLTIENKTLNLKKLVGEVVAGFFPLADEKNLAPGNGYKKFA